MLKDVMYCQSKDKLNSPRPSLLLAPPKRLRRVSPIDPVAFIAARQGIETEFNHGKI